MKRYNMIKNLMIASATATLYWGNIARNASLLVAITATLAIFILQFIIMQKLDKAAINEAKERRRKKVEDNARETASNN